MNEYFINYDKSRDACSITWESVNYDINELEPYIYAIQCDDGDIFHELISSEWPESNGKDDFQTIELNNFEAVKGDGNNEFFLCFTAVISINPNKHTDFFKALEQSNNQIVARIQFKKDGKPIIDEEGYQEYLYEMNIDNFVQLEGENDLSRF